MKLGLNQVQKRQICEMNKIHKIENIRNFFFWQNSFEYNVKDSPDWSLINKFIKKKNKLGLWQMKKVRYRYIGISKIHQVEKWRNLFVTEFLFVNSTDLEQVSDRIPSCKFDRFGTNKWQIFRSESSSITRSCRSVCQQSWINYPKSFRTAQCRWNR